LNLTFLNKNIISHSFLILQKKIILYKMTTFKPINLFDNFRQFNNIINYEMSDPEYTKIFKE